MRAHPSRKETVSPFGVCEDSAQVGVLPASDVKQLAHDLANDLEIAPSQDGGTHVFDPPETKC